MTDVFISYSREDRSRIEKIAAALEQGGFSVWWDRNLTGGTEFSKETEARLNEAKFIVVAWSKASVSSMWVADEATVGRDNGNLVPVALDNVPPKIGFRQIQTIDFARWSGDAAAPEFQDLVRALKVRLGGESPIFARAARRSWRNALLKPVPLALAGAAALAAVTVIVFLAPFATRPSGALQDEEQASEALHPEESSTPADGVMKDASIAVLPFTDLSPEKDQQYFSDGIAEEILNVLVRIDGLKVASRTSSFQFRDRQIGTPAIAGELGVRHVLEGSVRKAGETIRVTAQLIDAQSDRHLWSATYDRPLTTDNVFAIQDEIAGAIVGALAERIGAGASPGSVSVAADTQSVEAYELYLKGRGLFVARGTENLKEAARALEGATALDPEFARAWETLAMVYAISESWEIKDRQYLRLSLDAADRALLLNPELSMPYAARGEVVVDLIENGEAFDWRLSLANLNEALARDPKNATAWFWRGQVHLILGYFDRGIDDIGRCHVLDPGYRYCLEWLAIAHRLAGRNDEALRLFELLPEYHGSANAEFAAVYAVRGDRDAARAVLADVFAGTPQLAPLLLRALTDPRFGKSDRTKALSLLEKTPRSFRGQTAAHFILGDYDGMPDSIDSMVWWNRSDERYLKSPARKALMRRFRLPDYWRKHGFPPQCHAVGKTDFECE